MTTIIKSNKEVYEIYYKPLGLDATFIVDIQKKWIDKISIISEYISGTHRFYTSNLKKFLKDIEMENIP